MLSKVLFLLNICIKQCLKNKNKSYHWSALQLGCLVLLRFSFVTRVNILMAWANGESLSEAVLYWTRVQRHWVSLDTSDSGQDRVRIYRKITTTMANRIKSALKKIITEDQTGFISDIYTIAIDILQYSEQNNTPGGLLLVENLRRHSKIFHVFLVSWGSTWSMYL